MDYNDLTKETLAMAEEKVTGDLPNSPGLIYSILRSEGTFVIRGGPCQNLQQERERREGPFLFFELPRLDQAQILKDQLFNRRMPLKEELLYNLSDPGLHWWLDLLGPSKKGFRVDNRGHKDSLLPRFLKLGPLGNPSVFNKRFSSLSKLLPLQFSFDGRGIHIQGEGPYYKDLLTFFQKGAFSQDSTLGNLVAGQGKPSLQLFLEEVSLTRRFWMKIERDLQ